MLSLYPFNGYVYATACFTKKKHFHMKNCYNLCCLREKVMKKWAAKKMSPPSDNQSIKPEINISINI